MGYVSKFVESSGSRPFVIDSGCPPAAKVVNTFTIDMTLLPEVSGNITVEARCNIIATQF